MKTAAPPSQRTQRSADARRQFEASERAPLFRADWTGAVFIHFAVEPAHLQPSVPFALDLHEGSACVSLVAFTMERMRLGALPLWFSKWLLRPLSPCRYLNVRTYVREAGRDGIFFLAEWLSNHAAVPFGAPLFGLPYRAGQLGYRISPGPDGIRGRVTSATGAALLFTASLDAGAPLESVPSGTLEEFLLERYTAFTERRGRKRFFRVWHPPWPQQPLDLELPCASLLAETGPWCREARLIGAHFSPGVRDVWMGAPHAMAASLG